MRNVAAKRARRELPAPKFPDDLSPQPCPYCATPVVWCKGNSAKHARPVSVEVVPDGGRGDVAIERELIGGAPNGVPFAYTTNLATAYRWHGPVCPGSFTGQAKPRKVRS